MQVQRATAIAHPNIALIKYWGNRDDALRLPANSSLSMNLVALTTTTVEFRLTSTPTASVAGLHHYDVDVGSGVQDLCPNG